MLRSLNSGVSGLKAFQTKLDVIGNNIANVNTVGYKKSQVVFEDLFSQTLTGASAPAGSSGGTNPIQVGLGTKVSSIHNLFTQGSPTSTYNQTDLYIDGDEFFVVNDGTKPLLTRAGNFKLDNAGNMVNSNGMKVLDTAGTPITLPGCISFTVSKNGVVTGIKADGTTLATTTTLRTVVVTNPNGLKKEGSSLYSETTNTVTTLSTNPNIISGQLEMSNVDLSEEMTDMIVAQRGFQANAKIITVSDSILEELVNLKR
jgi:flagellar hook protein FlgE